MQFFKKVFDAVILYKYCLFVTYKIAKFRLKKIKIKQVFLIKLNKTLNFL